ncbi:hypothetical protein EJ08DRAFT_666488 [Tothia fuscella]|uniref:Histidine kinase n=1 Tax=Tothia fuscella TaxID=1048955 RepID=A0A9P4TSS3_9PEZI|nr:hypothetical protein EJ08DRAFT_666488 [Tothia fuscella]
MTSPKSIFTVPESSKPFAQSNKNDKSRLRTSEPNSESLSKPILPPGLIAACRKEQSISLSGPVQPPIDPDPSRARKRTYTEFSSAEEPLPKRHRICSFPSHTVSRVDFDPQIPLEQIPAFVPPNSQPDPTTPTSPLFFSNSRGPRPPLPPRFSSGEAASRMLSQAGHAEEKVKTVTLARASYSGQSPSGSMGHSSHRASLERSVVSLSGTISPEESRNEASRILGDVGVAELLEQDFRPTFIVDLGDSANYSPGPLKIVLVNSSLRSNLALYDFVQGRTVNASPRSDPHKGFPHFKAWLLSATYNGESLDVCLPAFVNGGVSWSCSTLRKRLRIASAGPTSTGAITSTPGNSSTSSLLVRSSGKGGNASSPLAQRVLEEPQDYFGDAVPSPTAETHSREVVPTIESAEDSESDELILPDIGFFDWTRLPFTNDLPRHIQFARCVDWASTPLGPIEFWSPDLRQMCNLIMATMYWGDDLVAIYNEAYVLLAGQKHPHLMGANYRDAWAEIWDDVKDVFANARITGQATMKDDDCLFINRSNFLEETYFSWSIIPMVGGDGTVTGLYNPAFEKTRRKIVERRMLTLREVGERTAIARDVKSFWQQVGHALETNPYDAPYWLLYSVSEDSDSDTSSIHSSSLIGVKQCYLEGSLGVQSGHPSAPAQIDLKTGTEGFGSIFRNVMKTGKPVFMRVAGTEEEEVVQGYEMDATSSGAEKFQTDVGPELDSALIEDVDWQGFGDPCRAVVVCPVHPTTADLTLGFMVLGVNPRRPYDDDYSLFLQLLSRQLATSLASVVLFEEEIRRGQKAAKLAARDRIELSTQLAARTQEARDSETRFTRMAEFSPAGLFIADSQGHITYCNDTWYEITRVPKDSDFTDSKLDDWIEAVSEDDQPRVRNLWYELVEHCRSVTAEFRFKAQWEDRNGNKSDTWVLFSAYPETYSEGESPEFLGTSLKSVFGSLTNISQQKWAEGFQKRKMEEAVELKRQQENFIDITSHEMRNPLSAILQCADEISTRLGEYRVAGSSTAIDDELLANSIDAAQTIMLCAQHQKTIVDDVLTLSKLDSQMLLVTPVDVQPVVVVQRALKMFENEIQNADITMGFHIDESLKRLKIDWVRVDPQRLLQVLINLITNGIKFTTGAGIRQITITVAASLEKPVSSCGHAVDFFPSHKKSNAMLSGADWGKGDEIYLQFAVQDTGRGLSVEEKKMLFMRFSQASPRTHIQYGGSGLGLFISRELTELQGGEIGVSSVAGKGSTFAFYVRARRSKKPSDPDQQFPALVKAFAQESKPKRVASVKARDFAPVTAMQPNQSRNKADIRVLIVEDNLVNQRVLQKQLENHGFTVRVANHGGECLDQLRESAFWHLNKAKKSGKLLNVILMDQEMPVMDGLQCTKTIREWEKKKLLVEHVPIIGVTANARVEQIQALLLAGMDDVVSKPFRIPDIVPKIEDLTAQFSSPSEPSIKEEGSSSVSPGTTTMSPLRS